MHQAATNIHQNAPPTPALVQHRVQPLLRNSSVVVVSAHRDDEQRRWRRCREALLVRRQQRHRCSTNADLHSNGRPCAKGADAECAKVLASDVLAGTRHSDRIQQPSLHKKTTVTPNSGDKHTKQAELMSKHRILSPLKPNELPRLVALSSTLAPDTAIRHTCRIPLP